MSVGRVFFAKVCASVRRRSARSCAVWVGDPDGMCGCAGRLVTG